MFNMEGYRISVRGFKAEDAEYGVPSTAAVVVEGEDLGAIPLMGFEESGAEAYRFETLDEPTAICLRLGAEAFAAAQELEHVRAVGTGPGSRL